MGFERPGKISWTELFGSNEEEASAKIEKQNPTVDAIVILEPTSVTEDLMCGRVEFGLKYKLVNDLSLFINKTTLALFVCLLYQLSAHGKMIMELLLCFVRKSG